MQIILFIFTSFLSKYEPSSIFVTKRTLFDGKELDCFYKYHRLFFTANF